MSYSIDFNNASPVVIEAALCRRIAEIRLARNVPQAHLATQAGVSERTLRRMEAGEGVSLNTFLRVLGALGIQHALEALLPDPSVRPVERVGGGGERKRASPQSGPLVVDDWTWGDGEVDDD